MPAGRPSKLTKKVVEKICEGIRIGLQYEQAAIRAGIDYATFKRWKARGDTENRGMYHEFCATLKEAEIQGESFLLANIQSQGTGLAKHKGQWQALAWILERRHPKRWSSPDSESRKEKPAEAESETSATTQHPEDDAKFGSLAFKGLSPSQREKCKAQIIASLGPFDE